MIQDHLTKAGGLKPVNIMQAAEADVKRFVRNTDPEKRWEIEVYAFHRRHVRDAVESTKGAEGGVTFEAATAKIIANAAADLDRGLMSGKKWTRRLYADQALLIQALDHAGRP